MNGTFKILMNSLLLLKTLQGEVCLWGGWFACEFGCCPAGESAALAVCSQSGRAGSGESPGKVFSWIPVQAPRTSPSGWNWRASHCWLCVVGCWPNARHAGLWFLAVHWRPGRCCEKPHRAFLRVLLSHPPSKELWLLLQAGRPRPANGSETYFLLFCSWFFLFSFFLVTETWIQNQVIHSLSMKFGFISSCICQKWD